MFKFIVMCKTEDFISIEVNSYFECEINNICFGIYISSYIPNKSVFFDRVTLHLCGESHIEEDLVYTWEQFSQEYPTELREWSNHKIFDLFSYLMFGR